MAKNTAPASKAAPMAMTAGPLLDRYDIVAFVEAAMANPNGDPDAGNQPRQDPVDGTGMITNVCLKRKVRDYLAEIHGVPLYHANNVVLREQRAAALTKNGIVPSGEEAEEDENGEDEGAKPKGRTPARKPTRAAVSAEDLRRNQRVICGEYWDARVFGGVLDAGAARAANARGPVTFSYGMSVDPVRIIENSITRQSVETPKERDKERMMGSQSMVRYGLYRFDVAVHPFHAQRTGFDQADLALLREALVNMFEFDQSSNRRLTLRGIHAFRHEARDDKPCLGNAPRASLLERVRATKRTGITEPTSFADYSIELDDAAMPEGVILERWA